MFARLRTWAREIKRDVVAVWLARRDPRVPLHAKALAVVVAGYALSPIDLIPDFIPVIGYVDDAVLVPLGILLVVRLIPDHIMAEHRAAANALAEKPRSTVAAVVIATIWVSATIFAGWVFYRSAR
jgi:uncharacterized membrane protein YkvA (DUF1232 family)